MRYIILLTCLSFFGFCNAQNKFTYKKERIDPLTFEESFFSHNDESNYNLLIKEHDSENKIEIGVDKYGNDTWIANYLYDIDRIDYQYLGAISKNVHALIIRFTGGTISRAKIIFAKLANNTLNVIGTKEINKIPKSGIIANYKYIHLGRVEILVSDVIGTELTPPKKDLVDLYFPIRFKKYRNVPFVNPVFDVFKIELINGKPIFTYFSFEKFDFFNKPKGRIEKLAKNETIKFYFKNKTTLTLKYEREPVVVKKEVKKLIISNVIFLSKFEIEILSKSKIIAIETGSKTYFFKGDRNFQKNSLHSFKFLQIPSDIKYAGRKMWKLIR